MALRDPRWRTVLLVSCAWVAIVAPFVGPTAAAVAGFGFVMVISLALFVWDIVQINRNPAASLRPDDKDIWRYR